MNKADHVHRALAKVLDFLVMGTLSTIPSLAGVAAASVYALVSDGLMGGRSLGKRLFGLKVLVVRGENSRPCGYRESMIRNVPYAVAIALGNFPWLGWLLFLTLGLLIIAVEAYFAYSDDQGIRLGDIFADTQVVDDAKEPA